MGKQALIDAMTHGAELLAEPLLLRLPGTAIAIWSNSQPLLMMLADYFRFWKVEQASQPIEVFAIEKPALTLPVTWTDWRRERGKTGRKDAIFDVEDGRFIRKVRTGMLFFQSKDLRVAAGPCLANGNQVINFIDNQYMTLLQQRNWLICHAAALAKGETGIAIAGFSGGGKSTMMLHLLNDRRFSFVTNDRLFVKAESETIHARGVPKLPRINPGTIVNNARLRHMLTAKELAFFENMPRSDLWDLELKYDVDIEEIYGPNRIVDEVPLRHFLVLNWSRKSQEEMRIQSFQPEHRPDLLKAVMKPPGPFYQHQDGTFLNDSSAPEPAGYASVLRGVNMVEVTGKVDFAGLQDYCLQELVD